MPLVQNPDELTEAADAIQKARESFVQISKLPREIGAKVQWHSQGVRFVRVGDNKWHTDSRVGNSLGNTFFPSLYIVSLPWGVVE